MLLMIMMMKRYDLSLGHNCVCPRGKMVIIVDRGKRKYVVPCWRTKEMNMQVGLLGINRSHYLRSICFLQFSYTTHVIETAGTTFSRFGVSPLKRPRTPSPLIVWWKTSIMPV